MLFLVQYIAKNIPKEMDNKNDRYFPNPFLLRDEILNFPLYMSKYTNL